MNPVISIIIPSLNDLINLEKIIISIQNQIYKNYEVIIIDALSTDGTTDYLKKLKAPFYWESNKDNGIYDAMNKGIFKAKGKWILFLGTDDQLYDNSVLQAIFTEKYSPETDMILGNIQYDFNNKDTFWIKRNKGIVKPSWSNKLWIRNTLHHQGILYKKEIIKNNNLSLQYDRLSDYALNLKLYNKGVNVIIVDRIVSLCGTKGVSKKYDWDLYKQEINLKAAESKINYKPLFTILGWLKYSLKNIEKLF